MKPATRILIDELTENGHIEDVADVIFWALEHYAKTKDTKGGLIASCITERILEAEKTGDTCLDCDYEIFFKSENDDFSKVEGWVPIANNQIKHPEKIEYYIKIGLLRKI